MGEVGLRQGRARVLKHRRATVNNNAIGLRQLPKIVLGTFLDKSNCDEYKTGYSYNCQKPAPRLMG